MYYKGIDFFPSLSFWKCYFSILRSYKMKKKKWKILLRTRILFFFVFFCPFFGISWYGNFFFIHSNLLCLIYFYFIFLMYISYSMKQNCQNIFLPIKIISVQLWKNLGRMWWLIDWFYFSQNYSYTFLKLYQIFVWNCKKQLTFWQWGY